MKVKAENFNFYKHLHAAKPETLKHRWQTQGPWAESGPTPCFYRQQRRAQALALLLGSSYMYTVLKLHSTLWRPPRGGGCGPRWKWVWRPCWVKVHERKSIVKWNMNDSIMVTGHSVFFDSHLGLGTSIFNSKRKSYRFTNRNLKWGNWPVVIYSQTENFKSPHLLD